MSIDEPTPANVLTLCELQTLSTIACSYLPADSQREFLIQIGRIQALHAIRQLIESKGE